MTAMLPPESLLNNRYRVVAHVGQGGMGSVYKALGGPSESLNSSHVIVVECVDSVDEKLNS